MWKDYFILHTLTLCLMLIFVNSEENISFVWNFSLYFLKIFCQFSHSKRFFMGGFVGCRYCSTDRIFNYRGGWDFSSSKSARPCAQTTKSVPYNKHPIIPQTYPKLTGIFFIFFIFWYFYQLTTYFPSHDDTNHFTSIDITFSRSRYLRYSEIWCLEHDRNAFLHFT